MKHLPLLFFVALLSCTPPAPSVEKALIQYDRYILFTNADSIASMFVEDGKLGEVGAPAVVGRDSIRALLQTFAHIKVLATHSTPDTLIQAADSARIEGIFRQMAVVGSDTLFAKGKFYSSWVLVDGKWKLKRMLTESE